MREATDEYIYIYICRESFESDYQVILHVIVAVVRELGGKEAPSFFNDATYIAFIHVVICIHEIQVGGLRLLYLRPFAFLDIQGRENDCNAFQLVIYRKFFDADGILVLYPCCQNRSDSVGRFIRLSQPHCLFAPDETG